MKNKVFALLVFVIFEQTCLIADNGTPAKYQYIGRDGNLTFHGYFIKTSPHRWMERAEKDGIHTYYFEEIQGDEGWITLFDSSRGMFARFRAQEPGPLELKSKVNETWIRFWDIEPVFIKTSAKPNPKPTPKPSLVPSPVLQDTPIIQSSAQPETTQPIERKTGMWNDKQIATTFGITGVIVMLAIAIFFPHPSPFQYTVFRVVLALVGAGVGATIPGLLDVNVSGVVRATGAIAVFVIVYFFSPAQLLSAKPASRQP